MYFTDTNQLCVHVISDLPRAFSNLRHPLDRHLVPTKAKNEVPLLFREPYVDKGFRAPNQPWTYYLLSVFQLHNESMNVWTHMIAIYLMTNKMMKFDEELDFVNNPYTWPLLSGLLSAIFLYICSTGAHCMHSKSELVHYTSFMVDYAGIGIYGLGSVIVHFAYCSEDNFYELTKSFFIPLGTFLGAATCFCCTISKIMYKRPYPYARRMWQMTPVASIYILLILPVAHKIFICFLSKNPCTESIPIHIRQITWFLFSAMFFASDIPQRFKAGSCDHFGHSHQLFHICIMMSTYCQMDAVFIDMRVDKASLMTRPLPTFSSAFGPLIIVLLLEIVIILGFRHYAQIKLAAEKDTKHD